MKLSWTTLFLALGLMLAQAQGPPPCQQPMDSRLFARTLSELARETYGRDAKVRQFTDQSCLESSQIRQLATLYPTDQERLNYAYFAFSTVMDVQNYGMLETVFMQPQARDRFLDFLDANLGQPNAGPPNNWNNGGGGNWGNVPPPPPEYVPGYTGRIGCPVPMTEGEFTQVFQTLRSQSFDNTRLQLAQQILSNRCATAAQIAELTTLFDFDSQRLSFAQQALGSTYDIDNYHIVSNAFDFDSNRRELANFVMREADQFVTGTAVVAPPQGGNWQNPPPNGGWQPVQGGGGWQPPAPSHNPNDFATGGFDNRPVPPPAPDFMPGYTGRIGCPQPMTEGEFNMLLNTLDNQSFDNTRLDIAKQALSNKCATAEQVRIITAGFDFESRRLEFAKFAYNSTYDIDNYFQVSDAFDFDSTRRRLAEFTAGR